MTTTPKEQAAEALRITRTELQSLLEDAFMAGAKKATEATIADLNERGMLLASTPPVEAPVSDSPGSGFIEKTNREYIAWCKTFYIPEALDERGMRSLHGLWAWQEQERRYFALATHPKAKPADGLTFQQRVDPWLFACFGETIARDQQERSHRFIEEALELVQACGCTASEAHQLVDYVYGRPVGERPQEVGGVMVTLAALCLAHGIDMHDAAEVELARIWTKVEAIRAKQAAKPKHSPLPEHAPKAKPAGVPPLLVRDLAEITGTSVPDVCIALQKLGHGMRSTNMVVSGEEAVEVARMLSAAPSAPQDKEADRG